MDSMPTLKMSPVAPTSSQIISGNQRMTILTDGLLRLETTQDGKFEDRASTFAINRDFPTPKFDITKKDNGAMEIVTDRLFISWTGEAFGPTSLMVTLRRKGTCCVFDLVSLNEGWLMSRNWESWLDECIPVWR
jgi:hypothetical protein